MKNPEHQDDEDAAAAPPQNVIEFMQASPLAKWIAEEGIEFEIERQQDALVTSTSTDVT